MKRKPVYCTLWTLHNEIQVFLIILPNILIFLFNKLMRFHTSIIVINLRKAKVPLLSSNRNFLPYRIGLSNLSENSNFYINGELFQLRYSIFLFHRSTSLCKVTLV